MTPMISLFFLHVKPSFRADTAPSRALALYISRRTSMLSLDSSIPLAACSSCFHRAVQEPFKYVSEQCDDGACLVSLN